MTIDLTPDQYRQLQEQPVDYIELAFGDDLTDKQRATPPSPCETTASPRCARAVEGW